jgi:uncharacterized delta-60 repeat protein/uncharacterized repeat protein (TIGR01451 family)
MYKVEEIVERRAISCRRAGSFFAKIGHKLFLQAFLGLIAVSACAQSLVPVNDNFANAQTITGPSGSVRSSDVNATAEASEPPHNNVGATNSIWFSWTAPSSAWYTFDTRGSTDKLGLNLNTVLGIYTNPPVDQLIAVGTISNTGNPNDDDPSELANGISNTVSRVDFLAVSGTTYYIAVDSADGFAPGAVVLNWNTAPNSGTFAWASGVQTGQQIYVGAASSIADQNVPTTGTRFAGSFPTRLMYLTGDNDQTNTVTITRKGGFTGRVHVQYEVTSTIYTNIFQTNIVSTNISIATYVTTNAISPGVYKPTTNDLVITYTNLFLTNMFFQNKYQDNLYGNIVYDQDIGSVSVAITNVLTTNKPQPTITSSSDVFSCVNLLPTACLNQIDVATNGPDTNGVYTVTSTNIFCNRGNPIIGNQYVDSVVGGEVDPNNFVPNYVPVYPTGTNEMVFDDFQMSASAPVNLADIIFEQPDFSFFNFGGDYSHYGVNRTFVLNITNVYMDALESPDIVPPTIDPVDGSASINLVQTDVKTPNISACETNTVFNWEYARYQVGEGGQPTPVHGIPGASGLWIQIWNAPQGGASVQYRINWLPNPNSYDNYHTYPLEPGSDYGKPGIDCAEIIGTASVPAAGNWLVGIALPRPFASNDTEVEFNEDIRLQLFNPQPNQTATAAPGVLGSQSEATVTIKFNQQPAGAVDRGHNPDFSPSSYPSFNPVPGANGPVYGVAVQGDDQSVIVGDFTAFDTVPANRIARLTTGGLPDSSFNPGDGANEFITSAAIDSNGNIVIGGGFTSFNGTTRYHLARLLQSGAVDNSFKPGFGTDATIWATTLQPDGKILIGGEFSSYDATNRNAIARINADGSLDTSFAPSSGANDTVFAITMQPDGKIVIGGQFTKVNGVPQAHIARLNTDGSLDTTFNSATGFDDNVYAIAVQPDGKLVVGGAFTSYYNKAVGGIIRINADGSYDSSFDTGTGANSTVYAVKLQSDGAILIGGRFNTFNDTRRVGVARLLTNGWLDTSFMDTAYNQFAGLANHFYNESVYDVTDGYSPNNTRNFVFSIGLESSGDVMIGGGFQRVGGGGSRDDIRDRYNVARLVGGATPGPGNVLLTKSTYTVDENAGVKGAFMNLLRTNGTLGAVGVHFNTNLLAGGPGAATTNDFKLNSKNTQEPTYQTYWPATTTIFPTDWGWMKSDGFYGPSESLLPTPNTKEPNIPLYLDILDNPIVDGNRAALLNLLQPDGTSTFALGGETIPLGVAFGNRDSRLQIIDNDYYAGTFGFSQPTYTVNRNSGSITINVVRTNASNGSVVLNFTTVNGTALNTVDYVKTNGSLTFGSGVTSRSFTVKLLGSPTAQPDKTFGLQLSFASNPGNYGVLDPATLPTNAVVTIIDNTFTPGHLNFTQAIYTNGETAGNAVISVARTGGSVGAISVDFAATAATAVNGVNFVQTNGTLVWNNTDLSTKTFTVPLIHDGAVTGPLNVNLSLSNAKLVADPNNPSKTNILGPLSNAVLTIVDADAAGTVQFISPNFNVLESSRAVRVTVSRTGGVAGPATVYYATTNLGPATNDLFAQALTNYSPTSGQLNFAPGEFSKTFDVLLVDNGFQNVDKVFGVNLFNAAPASLLSNALASATVTIIDDETQHTPPGQVDTSYTNPGFDDFVLATTLQPDGKLVAGGNFTHVNNFGRSHVARLNVDGTVDTGFGNSTDVNGNVRAVLSQVPNANISITNSYSNGPIVIAGDFDIVNNVFRHKIARLTIDGSLDTVFNPGAGADGVIYALAQTVGGNNAERKVLAAGAFAGFNGVAANGIVQLNDDGSVDRTFNTSVGVSGIDGIIYALAVQADRKIIIGGDFTMFNGVPHGHIARLNPDGSLDSTFNTDTGLNGSVRAIAIQPDGKIVIGGLFATVNGTAAPRIARLNLDGSVDNTFNIGLGANDSVLSLAIDSQGRILAGGEFTVASGVTRYRVTRLAADGTVDPSINFGAGADSFIATIALQSDDQIIVGGGFTSFNNIAQGHIARLAGGANRGNGQVTFEFADYVVNENGSNALITLRRDGGTESSLLPASSVDFVTIDGSAVAGVDYVGVTNTVVFPRGETFAIISVPIIDNTLVDGDRTVQLLLTNPTNGIGLGVQPFATLTIINDDSGVSFGSAQYRVAENTPAGAALIPVVRSGSTLGTLSVDVATIGGTAQAFTNYVPATNTFVFGPGESNKLFRVQVLNDGLVSGDHTVDLQLSNPIGGYTIAPNVATLTIAESSFGAGVLSFSQTNFSTLESSGVAIVTVQRTNGSTGPVSVTLSTGAGTAIANQDYQSTNVVVNFADGEITKDVAIKVIEHSTVQPDKTFTVTLVNPLGGATLGANNPAIVTILDDHMNFSFSSPAYFVRQDAGTVIVTVMRNSGTNGSVTVDYATTNAPATNGVALPGVDYSTTAGTLTFAPGEVSKSIFIPILDDHRVSNDEQFTIALSNPGPNTFLGSPSVATITIINVHSGLGFSSPTYVVTEGQTNALITVNRSAINTGTVSVNFFTTDGTAHAGLRYVPTNGTLTFAQGQATASFTVPIVDNAQVDGDQTVFLTLLNPSTGASIVQSNAVLTVQDNDIGVRFSTPSYRVLKSGVASTITVQRTSVTNLPVSVDFTTKDGTALAGVHYVATNGTLNFLPGETTKTFDVTIIDNNIITGDKNFSVLLSNPSTNGVVVFPGTASVTIVEDNGSLVVPAGTALLSESGPVNGLVDPNETVTLYFAFRNTGGGDTTNLVATLLNTNGVINASAATPSGAANAASYGRLIENGPSVSQQFTFKANATNGQTITATFQLEDVVGSVRRQLGTGVFSFSVGSQTFSFTNSQSITILDSTNPPTKASAYPSQIFVSGVPGNVAKATVTFVGLTHTYPDDIDALLVGPNNASSQAPYTLLMAAVGGPFGMNNVRLTFDDAYPALPNEAPITTGTNHPTLGTAASLPSFYPTFPTNAPPGPYPVSMGVFNGMNPNGLWSLYLVDSTTLDNGQMSGGWILNVTTGARLDNNADLGISITSAPTPATVSNVVQYHVSFTNFGPAGATNLVFTDILPTGMTYLSNNCNCTFDYTSNVLSCPFPYLVKGDFHTFDIWVRADVIGTFTNTITVKCDQVDLNLGNNTASVVTEVDSPSADLAALISITPNPVLINNNVAITMTAINNGFSPAIGVSLTNQLPAGLSLQTVTSSLGTAVITTNNTGLVVVALGNLPVNIDPATSPTVTIIATATNAVTSLVTARVGSTTFDPLKGNNTATAKVEVDAPPISFAVQQSGLVLTWPSAAGNLLVEQATSLAPPAVWTPVTDSSAVLVNGQYQVQVSSSNSARFFRLRAQ